MDVGHSAKKGCSIVPIYDDAGSTCVGYLARSERAGEGAGGSRWRVPAGFPKGRFLYGYAAARQSDSPFVLLVEGVPDALRVMDAGLAAVAVLGTDLTHAQAKKLLALDKEVIIAFDNDQAGRDGAMRALTSLRGSEVRISTCSPPTHFKDVGEMPPREIVPWLQDFKRHQQELDEILGP